MAVGMLEAWVAVEAVAMLEAWVAVEQSLSKMMNKQASATYAHTIMNIAGRIMVCCGCVYLYLLDRNNLSSQVIWY